MKTYELIVKKDKQYGLDKSPYVMGTNRWHSRRVWGRRYV